MSDINDPHGAAVVATAGTALTDAHAALILLHGRGASARDMLGLAAELGASDFAVLAPQAAGFEWYPQRFIRPTIENEPHLTSALNLIQRTVQRVTDAEIPTDRIVLGGFSQGACLALEFVARNPVRYGGVLGFSGGLIGELGRPLNYEHADRPLNGTPVFLGCDDYDPHIPRERFDETAEVLAALGADVTARLYPGMGHTINGDELRFAVELLQSIHTD